MSELSHEHESFGQLRSGKKAKTSRREVLAGAASGLSWLSGGPLKLLMKVCVADSSAIEHLVFCCRFAPRRTIGNSRQHRKRRVHR